MADNAGICDTDSGAKAGVTIRRHDCTPLAMSWHTSNYHSQIAQSPLLPQTKV